jgi:hypothetical protein
LDTAFKRTQTVTENQPLAKKESWPICSLTWKE